MKSLKKIIVVILIISILSSLAITAFAAPDTSGEGDWSQLPWKYNGSSLYYYVGGGVSELAGTIWSLYSAYKSGSIGGIMGGFTDTVQLVNYFATKADVNTLVASCGTVSSNGTGWVFQTFTNYTSGGGYLVNRQVIDVGWNKLNALCLAMNVCGFNCRIVKRNLYVVSGSDASVVPAYVVSAWNDGDVYTSCMKTISSNAVVDDIFAVNNNDYVIMCKATDSGTSLNTPYDTYTKPSQDPTTSTDGNGNTYVENEYNAGDTMNSIVNNYNNDNSTNYDNCSIITLEDGSQIMYDYRTGEFVNIENVQYSPVDNTYLIDYKYSDDDTTVNQTYITYNITNITYTYIGESAEYEIYEVYYKLPDGRSSADLTVEELEQLSLNFDVINYGVSADDGRLRALYHFDGDTEDSSYWSNYGGFDWVSGASITYLEANNFNGCLYLDEDDHAFDVTLPSVIAASDFSIFFRYYHSGTDTVATDFTLDFGEYNLFTATTGNTTTANVPVGNWVEIAIIRSGSTLYTYQNGIVTSSAAVSEVFEDILSFAFTAGSIYRYFDELRVFNFAVYEAGEDYTPTTVPVDTNAVLVLPGESYPIPDGYWEFNSEGNLFTSFDFSSDNDDSLLGIGSYLSTSSDPQHVFYSYSSSGSYDYMSVSSNSLVFVGRASTSTADYATTSAGERVYAYCPFIPLSFGSYNPYSLLPSTTYTFSMLTSSGSLYSFTFVTSGQLNGFGSASETTISSADFDWGTIRYDRSYSVAAIAAVAYGNCHWLEFSINEGCSLDIVYMELVEGDTPNTGHKYVTEIYSSEELTGPTIAVRSQIPINTYRVGGVRPTLPYRGDVWLMVEDARITSCQIYTGILWQEVDCRIWTGSAWRSPVYYDVITLQDMFDVNGTTDNVYIESEEGYYSWITVQFDELLSILNTISDQIEKIDTSGGGSGDVYVDLTFTDNGGITINFVQLTDTSRDGMLDVFAVLYDIFFSDALDELAGSLDNIASAYDKGGGQISGDGEKDYGVFSIFSDEVVWT